MLFDTILQFSALARLGVNTMAIFGDGLRDAWQYQRSQFSMLAATVQPPRAVNHNVQQLRALQQA
jgi:hypothetical protein